MHQFLKFRPILKEKIWGGTKLNKLLGKNSDKNTIGESWEISDVKDNVSIVVNGALKDKSLKDLITVYKNDLLGEKVYKKFKNKFPLLIKFIDAKEALSIQLHPDNQLAKKRHNSFGKTEMWYVMQADVNANLIVGFNSDLNKEIYLENLKNSTLLNILNEEKVTKGDAYFIPTGTVHAIGAGVLLAEIQQTSDITYRIYDWDRKDKKGCFRELHTEEAVDAINYTSKELYKKVYKKEENKVSELVSCPYFTTNIISVTKEISLNHSAKDSFVIYMCVKGEVEFKYKNEVENLKLGETILVPASLKEFNLYPKKKSELLEIYIQ